ncbi:TPA: hypothetical protein ACUNCG_000534 [Aeromonas hydrophila]
MKIEEIGINKSDKAGYIVLDEETVNKLGGSDKVFEIISNSLDEIFSENKPMKAMKVTQSGKPAQLSKEAVHVVVKHY